MEKRRSNIVARWENTRNVSWVFREHILFCSAWVAKWVNILETWPPAATMSSFVAGPSDNSKDSKWFQNISRLRSPFLVSPTQTYFPIFASNIFLMSAFRCVRSYRYRATERPMQCDHQVEEAGVAFGLPFHSQEWSISDFPCCLTRNITWHSMKNLAFQSLLRWKMIILLILTTSLIHLSALKVGRVYFVNLGEKGLMRVIWM